MVSVIQASSLRGIPTLEPATSTVAGRTKARSSITFHAAIGLDRVDQNIDDLLHLRPQ